MTAALYDPGLTLHRRLLTEARNYLTKQGEISFTHANLQSQHSHDPKHDFFKIEQLITEYGYKIVKKREQHALSYLWINYKIRLIQD